MVKHQVSFCLAIHCPPSRQNKLCANSRLHHGVHYRYAAQAVSDFFIATVEASRKLLQPPAKISILATAVNPVWRPPRLCMDHLTDGLFQPSSSIVLSTFFSSEYRGSFIAWCYRAMTQWTAATWIFDGIACFSHQFQWNTISGTASSTLPKQGNGVQGWVPTRKGKQR